jgi:hypothetical protein
MIPEQCCGSGLNEDSMVSLDPDPDPKSQPGSRRAKVAQKNKKQLTISSFEVLCVLF